LKEWREKIFNGIKENPKSLFILKIQNIDYKDYEFLKDPFDGENAVVTYDDSRLSPKQSVFILLGDFGSVEFEMGNGIENHHEKEEYYKGVIRRNLKKTWEDRHIHRISRMIPFIE